ncbi:MAG: hypothetical protein JJU06_13525, partial [Ectothiorhodospiraceae bacterium]|nr:hypothetical protein [Ectothiorhodospiraceae bacterium]
MDFANRLPCHLNGMRSSPSWLCLLIALLLSACGDAPDEYTRELHPAEAYTWEKWVERERSRRPDHYDPHYHDDRGLPDMRLWRPEDFLPEEDLTATHADICELPQEERLEVWRMPQIPSNIGITLEEKLAYAERGYVDAQASMSWYCYRYTNDAVLEPGQLSLSEALACSLRGAASGDPRAMYRYSDCLRFMSSDTQ